jgi:hypothetical protein
MKVGAIAQLVCIVGKLLTTVEVHGTLEISAIVPQELGLFRTTMDAKSAVVAIWGRGATDGGNP